MKNWFQTQTQLFLSRKLSQQNLYFEGCIFKSWKLSNNFFISIFWIFFWENKVCIHFWIFNLDIFVLFGFGNRLRIKGKRIWWYGDDYSRKECKKKVYEIYWKQAHIFPIIKKGDKHSPANYNEISVNCSLSKVSQQIIVEVFF